MQHGKTEVVVALRGLGSRLVRQCLAVCDHAVLGPRLSQDRSAVQASWLHDDATWDLFPYTACSRAHDTDAVFPLCSGGCWRTWRLRRKAMYSMYNIILARLFSAAGSWHDVLPSASSENFGKTDSALRRKWACRVQSRS